MSSTWYMYIKCFQVISFSLWWLHVYWPHTPKTQCVKWLLSLACCFSSFLHTCTVEANTIKLINEFRCYEAKIEESEKSTVTGSQTQDTSGISRQCSATELQQLENHQPSQFCICTAQVVMFSPHNIKIHLFPVWGKMLWALSDPLRGSVLASFPGEGIAWERG